MKGELTMTGDEWYHKNVVEDEDFVSSVGTLSQKMLYQKFNITIKLRTIPIQSGSHMNQFAIRIAQCPIFS